jgi:formate-dependent nitrite reductase membrane component NrfD
MTEHPMSERTAAERGPEDAPLVGPSASERDLPRRPGWDGPTYYGRSQVKASPFNTTMVGSYIFLSGLSGAAALLSTVADLTIGEKAAGTVRRGRYLSLLAPTLGAVLLISDLHTPKRFYNMLRIFKRTSPMSFGSWILVGFGGISGLSAAAQFLADCLPRFGWLRRTASVTQVPAAAAGAGLSTYTASLLSATSTPLWAAAPRGLAVRFGASAIASAAAALALLESSPRTRRKLETVAAAALATELAATVASNRTYDEAGVAEAQKGAWGTAETVGATGLGVLLPLGLYAASLALGGRGGSRNSLADTASAATLAGSALLRIATLGAGDESARRPEVSFRFSQPENLPRRRHSLFRRR